MKKIISLTLSVIMLLSITIGLDFSVYALDSTGSCGDNVSWTFEVSTGTLIITGTGDIYDYDTSSISGHEHGKTPFQFNQDIKSVIIENGITHIGECLFSNCKELTNIEIPNSVTSIGYYAFINCQSLSSIIIPNSVTSIGQGAFFGCSNVKEISIPCSTSIDDVVFSESSVLERITITKGTGIMQDYGDASSSTNYKDSPWYVNRKTLKTITIEDEIKHIGNNAFKDFTGLTNIAIPNSVTSIGDSAFSNCTSLKSISLPSSLITIGESAFSECTNINSITIPNKVTTIGDSAFSNCTSLNYIIIPNSVTSIGQKAFYGCTNIYTIELPSSVSYIGGSAFYECVSLTNVNIPSGITTIFRNTFYGCTNLTSIEIPDSVTSIFQSAFAFTGLKSIVLPSNIKTIKESAFNTLTEISVPASTKIDFSGFDSCNNLTKIVLTAGTGEMADWSVDYQDSLWYRHAHTIREIQLQEGIKNISDSAFYMCTNLSKTNVPSTVERIGKYAYYGCNNLKYLTISSPQCEIYDSANTISSIATIYASTGTTAEKYAKKYGIDFEATGQYICDKHTPITDKAVAPTCTVDGKTEGSHCSVCDTVLKAQEVVKATGHTVVNDAAVPATFKTAGKTAGSHCSVCGAVIVAQKSVAKFGAAKLSKVKPSNKKFTAKWKAVNGVDGYEIQYSLKKNMKSAKKKTVKGSAKKQLTVKKLKAKKTYYVRIRAYKTINGKKQYSAWSSVKPVKTKK